VSPVVRVCHRHGLLYRGRCPECVADPRRRWRDPEHTQLMNSYAWKRARRAARRRDGGCLRRDEGDCFGRVEVDHIVKPRHGGQPTALENLRTLCRHHHELEKRGR
jgi:5-methylcytosine-specific restriction endonuclease McrA